MCNFTESLNGNASFDHSHSCLHNVHCLPSTGMGYFNNLANSGGACQQVTEIMNADGETQNMPASLKMHATPMQVKVPAICDPPHHM